MAPTTLVLGALALTSSGDGAASQLQTPDAQAILRLAVEAASAVRTATYDARVQISIGGDLRRIITGQVDLVKFDYSDPVGGKLAVRGEAVRTDTTQVEPFHAVYDGETVGRLVFTGSGFSEERHQRLIDAIERQLRQIGGSSGN